jgi:mono/diheme cytochrome c family protein
MSHHNPEIQPPHEPHPNEAIQPDSHDFVETPDVPPITDDKAPVPIWVYVACGLAIFLAGSSFTGFGVFGQGLLDQGPGAIASAGSSSDHATEPETPMSIGKKIYGLKCASCHQANGAGSPGKYPPLAESEWVLGNKERLSAILLHGLTGPVTVCGSGFGTDLMPAWGGDLNDQKLADVMTYIRNSWKNQASEAKPEEVAATRSKFSSRTQPWTEAELMKIAPNGPDPDDKK